jgi:tetratricopeptide (TPR) repeat protein
VNITQNSTGPTKDTPEHYKVLLELGACHISMGNYKEAQRCYEESVSLGADGPQLYLGLGTVALGRELFEEAEVAFKVAIRLDKNCAEAFCGLAIIHQQKHDFAEAQQMYAKCLELNNDNLTALSGLFQASRQLGLFSKAKHYLEVYLKNHPSDAKVMFCLATLYVNDDQLNEAEKVLSDVLISEPAFVDAANLLEEVEHQLVAEKYQKNA